MDLILIGILNFLAGFLIDVFYVLYYKSVSENNRPLAVVCSMAISGFGALGVMAYMKASVWLVIPYIVGLGAGTYFAMLLGPLQRRWKWLSFLSKHKEENKEDVQAKPN